MPDKAYIGPLHQSVVETATDLWNDSCSVADLAYSLESGCVGATTNPNIVLNVLRQEMHLWKHRIEEISHIPGRKDLGLAGAQELVDHHPIIDLQPGGFGQGRQPCSQ